MAFLKGRSEPEPPMKPKLKPAHQKLSHKALCDKASTWAKNNGNPVVFNELVCACHENADVLAFNASDSTMIEVKYSRSDFLKDKTKWFRKLRAETCGNYKYYYCVEGVIRPEEIPDYWGLIYYYPKSRKSRIKLKAKKVPANKDWERAYLYSALRRVFEMNEIVSQVKYFASAETPPAFEQVFQDNIEDLLVKPDDFS